MYQMIGGLGSVKSDYLDKSASNLTMTIERQEYRGLDWSSTGLEPYGRTLKYSKKY